MSHLDEKPLVGGTPMVWLTKLAEGCGARVAAKRESFNPCSSVKDRIGVAIIDEFSVAGPVMPGLARVPLAEPVPLSVYIAQKAGRVLSSYADYAIERLRDELRRTVAARPWRREIP